MLFRCRRKLKPSSCTFSEQVFVTVILAYAVFGDSLKAMEYVGMVLIIFGMGSVTFGTWAAEEEEEVRKDGRVCERRPGFCCDFWNAHTTRDADASPDFFQHAGNHREQRALKGLADSEKQLLLNE